MYSPLIQKLIDIFSKFPAVGQRTAGRFVFYLMKLPDQEIDQIIKSIKELKTGIKLCEFCFNPFETAQLDTPNVGKNLCQICRNDARNKKILCIVEKETDLVSIENINEYKGLYFILGGTVSALKKENLDKLRVQELLERIRNPFIHGITTPVFDEIIIATNSTSEGEATALFLERTLRPMNKKITRLGRGLPVGGELEYADEETLKGAFEGRK